MDVCDLQLYMGIIKMQPSRTCSCLSIAERCYLYYHFLYCQGECIAEVRRILLKQYENRNESTFATLEYVFFNDNLWGQWIVMTYPKMESFDWTKLQLLKCDLDPATTSVKCAHTSDSEQRIRMVTTVWGWESYDNSHSFEVRRIQEHTSRS